MKELYCIDLVPRGRRIGGRLKPKLDVYVGHLMNANHNPDYGARMWADEILECVLISDSRI